MIVSASRRCDIPAYYADWLVGRIRAGYCLVANPFDARRYRRISLGPEEIDFLVLWTRDPRPLAPRLGELEARGIRFYFHVTITGYPRALEGGAPPLNAALESFRELSEMIGPRRALWRYDPVILAEGFGDESLGADWHRQNFARIAAALEGACERVTLSLVDEYAHTSSHLARAGFPRALFGSDGKGKANGDRPPEPYPALLADLAAIARSRGMKPFSCAEPYDLSRLGIERGACIDAALASSIWGDARFAASPGGVKAKGQRQACGCAESVDIGAYGSCPSSCVYCYANRGIGQLLVRGEADESLALTPDTATRTLI